MYLYKTYLIALITFLIIDIVWLGFISRNLYQEKIGGLLKADVSWTAAIVFYLLFIVGIVFFVIQPALAKESWRYALFAGGFFGMITYATYDMTNLATLKNWSLLITIVDIVWGTVLCGLTSLITFSFMKKFGGVKG